MIVGGLDVGTTGCKIVLYNEQAQLLATYYNEYKTVHKNGRHEIDFADVKNGVFCAGAGPQPPFLPIATAV